MLRAYTLLPVTACAGLIAGAGLTTFLAAALSAAAALWLRRHRQDAQACFANLDPQKPDATLLLAALREALTRSRNARQPVRLRLAAFVPSGLPAFRLDLNRERDLELACATRRPTVLKQPGAWLPDHPLPLMLPRARSLTLLFEPLGANRVRVSLDAVTPFTRGHWLGLALLATAACPLDLGWLLAGTLSFALQAYLLEQQPRRTPHDARVKRR